MPSAQLHRPNRALPRRRREDRGRRASLFLLRGILSFFHRDHPSELEVEARGVSAIVRGTEFVFAVDPTGKATVTLYDGAIELANPWGRLLLQSGQSASVHPGEEPRRTAVLLSDDRAAIQWALYYPAILDLADLGWLAAPEPALEGSFDRYREGDIPRAMAAYPKGRMPASAEEKLFLAALLLSVGSLEESERWLDEVGPGARPSRLAAALREVAAAVNRRSCLPTSIPPSERLATEWMAASYCLQSQGKLAEALDAAQHAAQRAPEFGFAWSRQAELEFSFGRIQSARKLLERANASVKANSRILAQKDVDIAIRFESDPRNTSEGRHNLQFRVSNRSKHNIDSWHARVRVPSAIRPIENAWPVEENDGNGVIVYGITSDHMATGGNNHNGNHHDPKIPAGSARHYPSIGMRPGNEQLNNNAWAGSQEVSLEFYPNNQARAITAKFTIADMLHGFSKG
ncbi:MAG: FecR domain-containing protein [Bryobacteraceae bacterium]|nr:FecR domain-containing protein [Bryobacteraceae bacterium]